MRLVQARTPRAQSRDLKNSSVAATPRALHRDVLLISSSRDGEATLVDCEPDGRTGRVPYPRSRLPVCMVLPAVAARRMPARTTWLVSLGPHRWLRGGAQLDADGRAADAGTSRTPDLRPTTPRASAAADHRRPALRTRYRRATRRASRRSSGRRGRRRSRARRRRRGRAPLRPSRRRSTAAIPATGVAIPSTDRCRRRALRRPAPREAPSRLPRAAQRFLVDHAPSLPR